MLTFRNTLANNTLTALPEGIELLSDEALDYVTGGGWSDARDGRNGGSEAADRGREAACREDVAKGVAVGFAAGAAKGKTRSGKIAEGLVGAVRGGKAAYDKSPNCGPRNNR